MLLSSRSLESNCQHYRSKGSWRVLRKRVGESYRSTEDLKITFTVLLILVRRHCLIYECKPLEWQSGSCNKSSDKSHFIRYFLPRSSSRFPLLPAHCQDPLMQANCQLVLITTKLPPFNLWLPSSKIEFMSFFCFFFLFLYFLFSPSFFVCSS